MNSLPTYSIVMTDFFKKQLKKLVKKDEKLMENLKAELRNFSKQKAIFIESKVYKIRIRSKSKGKSGGYRAYVLLLEIEGLLAPVCIYSKNTQNSLSDEDLAYSLEETYAGLESIL